ncbi:MAG: hypothetical protein IT258_17295 [Saprospiraceae bacterium]|nr:hypothetical protein [Saprospiraceae bacterium]
MRNQLIVLSLFAFAFPLKAQLGIVVSSTQSRATLWQAIPENFIVHRKAEFLQNGTNGVIDYAFSLNDDAIRLRPGIQVMYANSVYYPHYFKIGMIGLQGNIEFALWGKKDKNGNKTPFRPFLQISPGLGFASMRYDRPKNLENTEFESFKSHCLAPSFGASLFLEFKLTPLLTVAPSVGYRYFHQLYWEDFTELASKGQLVGTNDRSNMREFEFGFRISLAFK